MAIDTKSMKHSLSTITGGLSGPAVKPVAIRMVWQVAKAVSIPVIGIGGIMNTSDAIEFFLAGASAVQIGTASFIDPKASVIIIEGIKQYLDEKGCCTYFSDIKKIIGFINKPNI